ncbi:unnamed protein product [Rhizophagus irregularis]|nr:unnamed protein product [Rhizophagus irregularis]
MSIVEPYHTQKSEVPFFLEPNQSKSYSFAKQVTMLTKVLYERRGNLELNPTHFKQMIEKADPRLQGLFDKLVKALVPDNRSAYNKVEARKTIVSLCYIMAGMRNKFVNDFKLKVRLYLSASGTTRAAIDTMNSIGFSACYTTVNNFKRKIANEHLVNIRKFLSEHSDHLYVYNLDDYHNIHEKRRPDTVTLSTAKHMVTCICKQVSGCAPIPIIFNNVSVHNPVNIDASNICFRLIREYHRIFDIAYTNLHCYDDAIAERKEERSMKGVRLIGFQEKNLHSLNDYITALQMILDINKDTGYLQNHIAPLVADWPGQLFVRKAITNLHKVDSQYSIPAGINSFIPILGPLHVSLNSREHVLIVYYTFFQKLFHFVFGKRKVLAKKPKPWRINLLLDLAYINGWCKIRDTILIKFGSTCKDIEYHMVIDLLDNIIPATLDVYSILFRSGSFNEYIETIFRIWTFALRWKRHNYNKAPLAFLSDIFYWQDTNHPFAEAVKLFLVNFNDYYVENMHSKIRSQTPVNSNVDNIIKQAYVIDLHVNALDERNHCELKDTFQKTKAYPGPRLLLRYVTDYFQRIFKNRGKSKLCKSKKKIQCQLATLGKTVDTKCLSTGYSTNMPPLPDSCDHCRKKLDDGEVLICGHGYYFECYQMMEYDCRHCEEYYKRRIYSNVNSFLDRLEKGPNVLTSDEQDGTPTEENETVEEVEANGSQEVHAELLIALIHVNTW